MPRPLICSSHTISGVLPGGPVASRHGFAERVEACAAAGYQGMCLHFRDFGAQKAAGLDGTAMKDMLQANGMQHNSIEFLTDWFMDGEAGALSRRNEALAFEVALALGVTTINVGSDLQGRGIPRDMLVSRFRDLCGRAASHGLDIALELVAWSDVRDVPTALEVIDGIDNAGLVIDAWHVFRAGLPLETLTRIPGRRIMCIQVNDADREATEPLSVDTLNRKLCGKGVFDLCGFLAALDRAGANIPVSVEVISPDLAAMEVREAATISHDTARCSLWPAQADAVR